MALSHIFNCVVINHFSVIKMSKRFRWLWDVFYYIHSHNTLRICDQSWLILDKIQLDISFKKKKTTINLYFRKNIMYNFSKLLFYYMNGTKELYKVFLKKYNLRRKYCLFFFFYFFFLVIKVLLILLTAWWRRFSNFKVQWILDSSWSNFLAVIC